MNYERLENDHERIEEDVGDRNIRPGGDISPDDDANNARNDIATFLSDKLTVSLTPEQLQIIVSLSNEENISCASRQLHEIHKVMITIIQNLQTEARVLSEDVAKLKRQAKRTQIMHSCYIFYSLLCVIILIFAVILMVFQPSYHQH